MPKRQTRAGFCYHEVMKLLATIKPEDVDDTAPKFDYSAFKPRTAARAIIFDGSKVALIRINQHGYYMLPGGGVEDEDMIDGLKREILEEIGCNIHITGEVGSTTIYMDRWSQKQMDYCYLAEKVRTIANTARTDFEIQEGHEVIWTFNLAEAIRLVEAARPQHRDGKLVRTRDLLFLKTAQVSE